MRKIARFSAVVAIILFTGLGTSNAQDEPIGDIGDGAGGVVCECNNNHKCVASGGGAVCKNNGDKCWNNDGNCR